MLNKTSGPGAKHLKAAVRMSRTATLAAIVILLLLMDRSGQAGDSSMRDFLVGEWTTQQIEFGNDVNIVFELKSNGRVRYEFTVNGQIQRPPMGRWRYSSGVLYETFQDWTGVAAVRKIDDDKVELTIISNGNDAYRGLKRIYRRKVPDPSFLH